MARAQARYQPRLVTDDLLALRQAAVAGVGAAYRHRARRLPFPARPEPAGR